MTAPFSGGFSALNNLEGLYVEQQIRGGGTTPSLRMSEKDKSIANEIDTLERELQSLKADFNAEEGRLATRCIAHLHVHDQSENVFSPDRRTNVPDSDGAHVHTSRADGLHTEGLFRSFGFTEEPEERDNMDLENLAMNVARESANNHELVSSGRIFLRATCALEIQRCYRGHLGRRIFKLSKQAWHEQFALGAALIIQKYWRRVLGGRQIGVWREKAWLQEQHLAATQVQRIARGMMARRLVESKAATRDRISLTFFSSGGRSEDHIRKRLLLAATKPAPPFSAASTDTEDSHDSCSSSSPSASCRDPTQRASDDEWFGWSDLPKGSSGSGQLQLQQPQHASTASTPGMPLHVFAEEGGLGLQFGRTDSSSSGWRKVRESISRTQSFHRRSSAASLGSGAGGSASDHPVPRAHEEPTDQAALTIQRKPSDVAGRRIRWPRVRMPPKSWEDRQDSDDST